MQSNLLLITCKLDIIDGMLDLLHVKRIIVLVVVLILVFATTAEWVVEEVIILSGI